jgi:hypothetical protein
MFAEDQIAAGAAANSPNRTNFLAPATMGAQLRNTSSAGRHVQGCPSIHARRASLNAHGDIASNGKSSALPVRRNHGGDSAASGPGAFFVARVDCAPASVPQRAPLRIGRSSASGHDSGFCAEIRHVDAHLLSSAAR